MTIIQSLESDLYQSREYGGIRFSLIITEAQKWLSSLQISERFVAAFEEFDVNPSTKTLNTLDELKIQWHNSLNA